MLVAGLLVVVVLKSWLVCFLFFVVFWAVALEGGGQKTTTGLQILFLGGCRDDNILDLLMGGPKIQQRGCSFCL